MTGEPFPDMSVEVYNYQQMQPAMYCPICNDDLTLAKPERGEIRPPKDGDNTVCGHCLAFLAYREYEPGKLCFDPITREAFEALPERYQIGLMQVRAEIATRATPVPTKWEAAIATELTKVKARVDALESSRCGCYYCKSGDGLNCIHKRRG